VPREHRTISEGNRTVPRGSALAPQTVRQRCGADASHLLSGAQQRCGRLAVPVRRERHLPIPVHADTAPTQLGARHAACQKPLGLVEALWARGGPIPRTASCRSLQGQAGHPWVARSGVHNPFRAFFGPAHASHAGRTHWSQRSSARSQTTSSHCHCGGRSAQ
jgi:hypothetical protein